MASRLFHAIVGVGVSLGATASCAGLVEEPDDAAVGIDARRDAVADAAQDAGLDAAFCDAPWPTTKGSDRKRPACTNPQGLCPNVDDAGRVVPDNGCIPFTGPYQCEDFHNQTWDFCINDQWQCPLGARRSTECKCWGPTRAGYVCTATGFKKIDGGP